MPGADNPPYKPRPGVNLQRFDASYHVDRETFDALRRASETLGWEQAKDSRRRGGGRDHPLYGPYMLDWETDTDTDFFFGGRRFVLSDEPGTSTFLFEEDRQRITAPSLTPAARRTSSSWRSTTRANGTRVWEYIHDFTHGAIDAGADICVNTGGYPRGIEIYQGKAIVYGQPGLYLQNEQFTRVPSSAMPLLGMSSDSSAGEFYDERMRMVTAVGGSDVPGLNPELGPPGVSSVGQVAFNEDNEITEIRVQPFEFLTEPRYRHGFPFLSKPGSTAAKALLDFMATRCAPFGTAFENEDRVRVVRVV